MKPIIDSSFASLEEAIRGTSAPKDVCENLALIDVLYISFDRYLHQGQLVVRSDLATEVRDLFDGLRILQFPVAKAVPIVAYGWDDDASMVDNNCSAFNYRLILGTDRLSKHSFGSAIDINPVQNPYYARDGNIYPPHAIHDPTAPGTLVSGSDAVEIFIQRGWEWGGHWEEPIDYQHFQKLPR